MNMTEFDGNKKEMRPCPICMGRKTVPQSKGSLIQKICVHCLGSGAVTSVDKSSSLQSRQGYVSK